MPDEALAFTSALEQADLVRRGEVSPTELVELHLERIERLNPQLDAYLTVAVPAGLDADGLPVSVQVVGRPNDESTIIRVAAQLEAARPWAHLRPPIS